MNKEQLTQLQEKILRYAADGAANRTIAERLYMSKDTVKAHMKVICKKLHATNRTNAAYIAGKNNLI